MRILSNYSDTLYLTNILFFLRPGGIFSDRILRFFPIVLSSATVCTYGDIFSYFPSVECCPLDCPLYPIDYAISADSEPIRLTTPKWQLPAKTAEPKWQVPKWHVPKQHCQNGICQNGSQTHDQKKKKQTRDPTTSTTESLIHVPACLKPQHLTRHSLKQIPQTDTHSDTQPRRCLYPRASLRMIHSPTLLARDLCLIKDDDSINDLGPATATHLNQEVIKKKDQTQI